MLMGVVRARQPDNILALIAGFPTPVIRRLAGAVARMPEILHAFGVGR